MNQNGMIENNMTGYSSIDKPWLKYYKSNNLNSPFPKMTTYEYLCEQTKNYTNNVAMTYFGRQITYAEMFRHIDEASQILTVFGVKTGNSILYLMPNIPETAYLFYGGSKIGAVSFQQC